MRLGKSTSAEPSVRIRQLEAVAEQPPAWRLPWPVLTIFAAVLSAAATWLLVAGFCLLGWIMVPQMKVSAVLHLGTQGWLLAHGLSVALPGAQLSITPLGVTVLVVAMGLGAIQQAVQHSRPPEDGHVGVRVARMGLVYALTYLIIIAIARSLTVAGQAGQGSMLNAAALVLGLGFFASARSLGWRPNFLPGWLRNVGLALGAALAVMVAVGAAVFIVALIQGRDRIGLIHDSLDPGGLGGVMLLLGQLAWLPNFLLWCGAWAIGAGVQLGVDTIISPAQSLVGILPAIPVLGAVPVAGPMPRISLLWLASGVAAGVAVALVFVASMQRWAAQRGRVFGPDLTAIGGALAGIGSGLVYTLLQLPAAGDLGSVRLIDLGARLGALAIMAPTSMGLAGMVTGALLGWRAGRQAGDPDEVEAVDEELAEHDQPTSVIADRRPAAETDE